MRTFIPTGARLIPENAKLVFQGVIFDVYQWPQEMFDGTTQTFEMLKRPDTVQVIAVKEGKIVVLEQEQPGLGFSYTFPAGRYDMEGENELGAAKREMLEETGMTFQNWRMIEASQPHQKIDWVVYTFLANDFLEQTSQKLDPGEKIRVTLRTFKEIRALQGNPKACYLNVDILKKVNSIEEILALPDCSKELPLTL